VKAVIEMHNGEGKLGLRFIKIYGIGLSFTGDDQIVDAYVGGKRGAIKDGVGYIFCV
jgi:hypothetical protein